MLLHLLLFFTLIMSFDSQMLIRLIVLDDQEDPPGLLRFRIPNVTFCNQSAVQFQLNWKNSSDLLKSDFQIEENLAHAYLARTVRFPTRFIQDYSSLHGIPFLTIRSIDQQTASMEEEFIVTPDILRVLANYLKYHRIQKAAYIYDHAEAANRIYQFLQLLNTDEYFNNFSLDLRTTKHEDIYSLLYTIEVNYLQKDQRTKYILLDLETYEDYEEMFDKVSHMGLTSDLYAYVIVSTFDACLWVRQVNFTGRLIYFDYQQRDCQLDYQPLETNRIQRKSQLPNGAGRQSTYYRSKISFRIDGDSSKSTMNRSLTQSSKFSINQKENRETMAMPCRTKLPSSDDFFSFSDFNRRLPKSHRLHGRFIYAGLNAVLGLLQANTIDCQTMKLNSLSGRFLLPHLSDVNIYTSKESTMNPFHKPMHLIGRYFSASDEYESCQVDERSPSPLEKVSSTRIYYITSVFDEPFLMLRKRTELYMKYSRSQIGLKQLRGKVFQLDELEGYCVDLAEKVCSILKITCRFRIVQDGAFGSRNVTTGLWNGMVGDIVSRTVDMAIAPLTISPSRMEVVDFSKPFMNLGISIMIRKPDAQKPGVFSFMNPVSMEIWLCFSLAYFAVSVVLFLTSRVVNSGWRRRIVRQPSYRAYGYPKSVNDRRKTEIQLQKPRRDSLASERSSDSTSMPSNRPPMRHRSNNRSRNNMQSFLSDEVRRVRRQQDELKKDDLNLFGISNALFFSFASFMRQSINLVPKSFSGRIAATSWWYFSLIFVSSYTANLVAFLTVEKLVTPIESVEDLAKQHEIKYGSLINGTTSAFFEKSNVSVFQHMWAVMQRSSSEVFVTTNDEGVSKVRNSKGKYAFFIESTKNEYVNERLPCDTMKVGSDLDSKGYGIATRLGSDLTEAINIIITNLRESGFLDKLKQRWWYERSECSQTTKDKRFSELSLSSVTGLFYIFLFGLILSCIIAFTEFLIMAKTESELLQISFKEILRIKLIENLVGITINAQRQLEFGRVEYAFNYDYDDEDERRVENRSQNLFFKSQSDV